MDDDSDEEIGPLADLMAEHCLASVKNSPIIVEPLVERNQHWPIFDQFINMKHQLSLFLVGDTVNDLKFNKKKENETSPF